MATLTADQLSDFRRDISDEQVVPVFSDAQLNRLYTRASGDYYGAVVLAIEQLTVSAAKFYTYYSGYTKEEADTIFNNLLKVRDMYKAKVGQRTHIVGVSIVPTDNRAGPNA